MSGRIRTIKPELLEDEKTAGLSHLEFRLFVSLLLMADDYGNLRGEPGLIWGQAFWKSELGHCAVGAAIDALIEVGLLEPYDVRGQRYLHVTGWSKHQRVDKPGKPRVPGRDDPEVALPRQWKTYFVRLGDDGPIKIGKTLDVDARVAKLQTSAPAPLKILAVADSNIETDCHRRFSDLRRHHEWFDPSEELLSFIAGVAKNDSRIIRESFANDSRLITDHRSPTTDHQTAETPSAWGPPKPKPEPEPEPFAFAFGSASCEASCDHYEQSVALATGKPYAMNRDARERRALVDLLNKLGPRGSADDSLAWLRVSIARWVANADQGGKFTSGWSPSKLRDWLNLGARDRPSGACPTGGQSARSRRDLTGFKA
ncbi:MAG: GIY-YIG nuclease family protein [Alsobacter sp.]